MTLLTLAYQGSFVHGIAQASGLPCPLPAGLPDPGIEPEYLAAPAWQEDSFFYLFLLVGS